MKCIVGIFLFEYGIEYIEDIKSIKLMLGFFFFKEKYIVFLIL